jgi:reactive intermediate/imine deaminase
MSAVKSILTADAPKPGGHYAQAVGHGGTLYISGMLPNLPSGEHRPDAPFRDQAQQAMRNLLAVLGAGGGRPSDLLKVTVFIVGVDNWPAFNALYAEMLGDARPARSVVPVPELHHGYLVELDAIARQPAGDFASPAPS